MKLTTAGLTAAALMAAAITMGSVSQARQADADAQLEVPRTPGVEADADVEAQRDADARQPGADAEGRTPAGLQTGQFVERADGQLQLRDAQGQVRSQRLADDAVVVIDGREAQWSDVRQGDQVRFQAGPDQRITRVMVVRDSAPGEGVAGRGEASKAGEREGVFLGVHITESPTTGVYVRDVMPGGPAAQGGIQARDYILTVNGEKVASPEEFDQKMASLNVGEQAKFEVWRNQQKQPVTVQLVRQQDQQLAQGQVQQPGQSQQHGQLQPGQQDRRAAFRPEGQQEGAQTQSRAWLGVQLQEAAPAGEGRQPQQGVRISDIYPSGPAARYGLRDGDMIVRIADEQVSSSDQISQLIARQKIGESVPVVVRRGDQEVTIEVVLADRSDFFFDQDEFGQEGAFHGQQSQQGRQSGFGDFQSSMVPEHAMMLEQHRRFAEQNERTHQLLHELQEEVQKLRKDLNLRNDDRNDDGADR